MDYEKIKEQYRKRREIIKALYNVGTPVPRIAAKYGITHQRVYQILDRNAKQ